MANSSGHVRLFCLHLSTFLPSMAISALGRAGKWKEAVQVLDGMGKGGDGGDRPDNFAYAAAINACGKAGRPVEVRTSRAPKDAPTAQELFFERPLLRAGVFYRCRRLAKFFIWVRT